MPRYYYQAETAVELPDDIFGCLPEFAMMMKHCCFLLLIADFDQALPCDAICFYNTVSSVSAVSVFNENKRVDCLFV